MGEDGFGTGVASWFRNLETGLYPPLKNSNACCTNIYKPLEHFFLYKPHKYCGKPFIYLQRSIWFDTTDRFHF